ncbi:spermidine/putrescine transport system substrate-binding protein [Gemmobacter megaterium]|uniref:Spermidine/putrescine transport system substrate-binding protein n=1 Tax=Gemmobacter megaterium TaxID=1086013 RepID=A0A1N7NNR4_9RHOB|nr:ABC transporter substrate-binding protein [Gemmobacter megaterium]GGE17757.1 polyamine ABC transporter substrate-binding protein [Gemmobacter megaterium]SIS99848.1 spermidine/putrescine transport system substrate-binding protein [Gemmobacter megaterium]
MIRKPALLASVTAFALATPVMAADPQLTVFDWAGFEVDGLFADYVAKHGTPPTFALFGDDDEAFQKVASGFKVDAVHPCSQMVSKYRDAGLIEPWDESRLTALADIDPEFLDSPVFKDDAGLWFLPSYWGATAVAYNTDQVPAEDVASLQVFVNPKYQGRTSMPDSSDDVWALAYLATGVTDWTAVTEEQYAAAAAWLREAHQNVYAYWADPSEQTQQMASGAVLVSWSWNDGVALLQAENYPVGFQREATEGSSTFVCGFVNMKDGPGSEDKLYDFMNSWLRPDAAVALMDELGYGHSNLKGMALKSEEDLEIAGLGHVDAPTLPQVPNNPQLRERQLAEFEKIKAGF